MADNEGALGAGAMPPLDTSPTLPIAEALDALRDAYAESQRLGRRVTVTVIGDVAVVPDPPIKVRGTDTSSKVRHAQCTCMPLTCRCCTCATWMRLLLHVCYLVASVFCVPLAWA